MFFIKRLQKYGTEIAQLRSKLDDELAKLKAQVSLDMNLERSRSKEAGASTGGGGGGGGGGADCFFWAFFFASSKLFFACSLADSSFARTASGISVWIVNFSQERDVGIRGPGTALERHVRR